MRSSMVSATITGNNAQGIATKLINSSPNASKQSQSIAGKHFLAQMMANNEHNGAKDLRNQVGSSLQSAYEAINALNKTVVKPRESMTGQNPRNSGPSRNPRRPKIPEQQGSTGIQAGPGKIRLGQKILNQGKSPKLNHNLRFSINNLGKTLRHSN